MKRRMNGRWAGVVAAIFLAAAVAGCAASPMSGESYSRGQSQRAMTVRQGTVESVRPVAIEGTKSGAGTLGGAVLGGALGSGIGRGTGRLVGAVGGAIVGGLAGSAVEESATKKNGLEITVKLDGGDLIAIVQALEPGVGFEPGDRVRVTTAPDGSARVSR